MTASRRDPHLGELAAALVDGALDHNARDRALAHMMRCECCRAEVDAQRRLKAQLAQVAFPPVSSGLAERLLSLPDRTAAQSAVGLPPARFEARFRTPARLGGSPQATGDRVLNTRAARTAVSVHAPAPVQVLSRPVSSRPATTSSPRGPGRHPRSRRRRIAATAAGGLAAFALSFAAVAAVGGIDEPPPVAPQIGTFITEHDQGSAGVPGRDPELGAVDATSTGR